MSTGKESTNNLEQGAQLDKPLPEVWGNWSNISFAERDALIDALQAKCHSPQSLRKQGYWTQIPSQQDLDMKKCRNCGEKEKKPRSPACRFHPAKKASETAHDFALAGPKLANMQVSPKSNINARKVVVLDCELVGGLGPNNRQVSEAIRVSAVDFLTGDILIDTYIEPVGSIIGSSS